MEGINPSIISHHLNVDPNSKPVRQKRWAMDIERYQALKEKVDKLLSNDFIKESFYPSWLTNPILVKKTKWQVKDMRGLHRSEQGLPKRQLPTTKNQQAGRHDLRPCISKLHGHLLWIQSDPNACA